MAKRTVRKIEVTLQLEVTNIRAFDKYAETRRGYTPPGVKDELVQRVLNVVEAALDETIPGLEESGCSGKQVEWFDTDHWLDRRHPSYKPVKGERRKAGAAGAGGNESTD